MMDLLILVISSFTLICVLRLQSQLQSVEKPDTTKSIKHRRVADITPRVQRAKTKQPPNYNIAATGRMGKLTPHQGGNDGYSYDSQLHEGGRLPPT